MQMMTYGISSKGGDKQIYHPNFNSYCSMTPTLACLGLSFPAGQHNSLHRGSDAIANCKAIDVHVLLNFASSSMVNDKSKSFPYWLRRRRGLKIGLLPSAASGTQRVTGYIAK